MYILLISATFHNNSIYILLYQTSSELRSVETLDLRASLYIFSAQNVFASLDGINCHIS